MRKSRLSQYKQSKLIELFVAGTTARTAAALVSVNSKSAIYYFQRYNSDQKSQLKQLKQWIKEGVT